MELFVSLGALVCAGATISVVVHIVQLLRFARRGKLRLKAAYRELLRQNDSRLWTVAFRFFAVLLSFVTVLAGSGALRHFLGSRSLDDQPPGPAAYYVQVYDKDGGVETVPAEITISGRASTLLLRGDDGKLLSDARGTFTLQQLHMPGRTVEFPENTEVSRLSKVTVYDADGELITVRLLDEVAQIEGFSPRPRRGLFYWLDIIIPIPVVLYLAHMGILLKRKIADEREYRLYKKKRENG